MLNKYVSRITSSARGEVFNPLIWPALMTTAVYGVGFVFLFPTHAVSHSSLFVAMTAIHPWTPFIWGWVTMATILIGFTFLLFNIPPAGKVSGLVGFMLWLFAGWCWILTGGWFVFAAIGIPNMWFWIWQYLSLSHFGKEVEADRRTMEDYDAGGYDSKGSTKKNRLDNRGVDEQ